MGATAAAAVEFFTGSSAAAGSAAAGTAGTAAAGTAAAGTGLGAVGTAAAAGAAAAVVGSLLAPDVPEPEGPAPMPDPLETERAKRRDIVQQLGRRGRSASILTNSGSGTLGGG